MRIDDKRGFTLIEVLVAVAIVSIGLMAVAGMQTTAITGNSSSRDVSMATQLAEEMVDRVRINGGTTPEDYNGIDTSGVCGGADPVLGDCVQWQARLAGSGLTSVTGTVTVTADTPITNAATVVVNVTWSGRSVSFTTIVETLLT